MFSDGPCGFLLASFWPEAAASEGVASVRNGSGLALGNANRAQSESCSSVSVEISYPVLWAQTRGHHKRFATYCRGKPRALATVPAYSYGSATSGFPSLCLRFTGRLGLVIFDVALRLSGYPLELKFAK